VRRSSSESGEDAVLKRRLIANVRFIGELFLCQEVPGPIMVACIRQLLCQVEVESSLQSEDSIQGLCKLLFTVGRTLDSGDNSALLAPVWEAVKRESRAEGKHSSRGRFALMDLLEARETGWKEREGQKGQSASGGKIEAGGGGGGGAGGAAGTARAPTTIRVGFGGVEYEGGRSSGHGGGGGREREREKERELIPHLTANERLLQANAMASSVTKWQPGGVARKRTTAAT
jgi:hypothetical protein